MDSFFKAAVCDLDKLLDDFELNTGKNSFMRMFLVHLRVVRFVKCPQKKKNKKLRPVKPPQTLILDLLLF